MSRVWIAVTLAGAIACARAPRAPRTAFSDRLPNADRPNEVAVTKSEGVIGYSGKLTRAGLEALKRSDDASIHALMVRSTGGEVGAGMDFGEWVHARGLDVIVVDYCLSSCANYVFPAARNKTILPGGVVAWHGDVLQCGLHDDPLARR